MANDISALHYQDMKYLQDMRDDVMRILNDTINKHYDSPPSDQSGLDAERQKLREDLREAQTRIERTLNGM